MHRRTFIRNAAAVVGSSALPACRFLEPAPTSVFRSERISVQTVGSGPDVILIPGLSSSRRVWADLVSTLKGYRYHLVQLAGFAGEPAPSDDEELVAAPAAEEIGRYIVAAELQRPAVIGHSMGGLMAMMLAARHPSLPGKLMVIDILPFSGILFGVPGTTAETVRPVADDIRAQFARAAPEERAARVRATLTLMANHDSTRSLAFEDSMSSDQQVSARAMHEIITTDLRRELPRISVPVTVLYVLAHNGFIGGEALEALFKNGYAGLKAGKLIEIPDSRHFLMFDRPKRFISEVRAFLGT